MTATPAQALHPHPDTRPDHQRGPDTPQDLTKDILVQTNRLNRRSLAKAVQPEDTLDKALVVPAVPLLVDTHKALADLTPPHLATDNRPAVASSNRGKVDTLDSRPQLVHSKDSKERVLSAVSKVLEVLDNKGRTTLVSQVLALGQQALAQADRVTPVPTRVETTRRSPASQTATTPSLRRSLRPPSDVTLRPTPATTPMSKLAARCSTCAPTTGLTTSSAPTGPSSLSKSSSASGGTSSIATPPPVYTSSTQTCMITV